MSLRTVYQLSIVHGLINAQLDRQHPLVKLSERIDWEEIESRLKRFFSLIGRCAKSVRLMIGAHILKHMYRLSDEAVTRGLKENLYWRAFCGITDDLKDWDEMQVFEPSTMTKFRKRLGPEGMQTVEEIIRQQMLEDGTISDKQQFVDSTAMEKNIEYPTDSALLDRGRRRIIRNIKRLRAKGLKIKCRSFARLGRKVRIVMSKMGRGRRSRIRRATTQLIRFAKNVLGALPAALRAYKRGADERSKKVISGIKEEARRDAELLKRIVHQAEQRLNGVHIKGKVFSLHEPHVVCIAKGKRHRKYEYGVKVSVSTDRNGFMVHHEEHAANVADVTTLRTAVDGWTAACGAPPEELATDRGYWKRKIAEEFPEVSRIAIPVRGRKKPPEEKSKTFRRLQARRSAQEAVLSHLKRDHLMDRCRYKGFNGDRINVSLASLAWNLKRWERFTPQARRRAA